MNIEEAKAILRVWRPDGRDHADPVFREALELARETPELLEWLHEQQEFDAAMTSSVRAIPPPTEARAEILAHGRMVLRHRRARRRVRLFAFAAACLLIAAGWWRISTLIDRVLPAQPYTLAGAAEHLSVHHKSMEFYSDDIAALQSWLQERRNPVPHELPGKLPELRGYGTQDWLTMKGRISLMCLYTDRQNGSNQYNRPGEWLHFFVFPKSFAGLPDATDTPQTIVGNQWIFIVWKEGENAFALGLPAREGAEDLLRSLLDA